MIYKSSWARLLGTQRHVTVVCVQNDPWCPAHGEEEKTFPNFLATLCAIMQYVLELWGLRPLWIDELCSLEKPCWGFRNLCYIRDAH